MTPDVAVNFSWMIWAASWLLAASWADAAAKTQDFRAEIPYRVLIALGFVLVCAPFFERLPGALLCWGPGTLWRWLPLVFVIIGFGFTWWARLHLGRLWSGRVARKTAHRIVETGPYAFVRHPIYTGLCLAALATALERAALTPLLGTVLVSLGFTLKARLEEDFLRQELGVEAYDAYARRVPMLVPFTAPRR